jgi:hypothetical protein
VSAGFTPGPWAEDYCDADEVWHVDAGAYPFGSTVCEIDQRTLREGDAEANARLIAAAPELYNGCNALLGLIQLLAANHETPPALLRILTGRPSTIARGAR